VAAPRTLAAPSRTGPPERAHPAPPPPGDSDAGCQGSVRVLESPAGGRPCRLGVAVAPARRCGRAGARTLRVGTGTGMQTHGTPHGTPRDTRPVQSRWELRDGRLRLRWALGPGGAARRQPGDMSFAEARSFLLLHSGAEGGRAAWRDGRLGPLLPAGGRLDNAFFQEVIAALAAVAPHRRAGGRPDRALAAALDDLGELTRRWAREPDAMGRRNGLGAAADGAAVAGRLEAIGGAVAALGV
jgi:hypothetical protein